MTEEEPDGAWPHPKTVYTPVAAVDPILAARLLDEYHKVLRAPLTVEEREYTDKCATLD